MPFSSQARADTSPASVAESSRFKTSSGDILLHVISLLGWLYTIIWSLSFYPQAILNYRRKAVGGLSIDFLSLNPFGFACYSVCSEDLPAQHRQLTADSKVYNVVLSTSRTVRREYAARHGGHTPQVQVNDIVFAVHALVLSLFTLGQSFVYKVRNRDRLVAACHESRGVTRPLCAHGGGG